jgi:hypothetical protein
MKHRGGQEEVAHEEFDDRVVVPAAVFKGLRAVALSGKANMLDRRMVQSWALRIGHAETVIWIERNPLAYEMGVFAGFIAAPEEEEQ